MSHLKSQFLVAWLGGGAHEVFSLPPTALSTNTQPPILSESFHHTPGGGGGTTRALLATPLGCFLLSIYPSCGQRFECLCFSKADKVPPSMPMMRKHLRQGLVSQLHQLCSNQFLPSDNSTQCKNTFRRYFAKLPHRNLHDLHEVVPFLLTAVEEVN